MTTATGKQSAQLLRDGYVIVDGMQTALAVLREVGCVLTPWIATGVREYGWSVDELQMRHWHRDGQPPSGIGFIVIRAVSEFTEANGATEILLGSSHYPEANGIAFVDPGRVRVSRVILEMPANSVAIFDSRLLHRRGINRNGEPRRAEFFHFYKPGLTASRE